VFHPSSDRAGGVLHLGSVSISIDNQELQVFVVAVTSVEADRGKTNHNIVLAPDPKKNCTNTEWKSISYIQERNCYNLIFRGVGFEVPITEIKAAVQEIKAYLGETLCFQKKTN